MPKSQPISDKQGLDQKAQGTKKQKSKRYLKKKKSKRQ